MNGGSNGIQRGAFRKRHNLALAYVSEAVTPLLRFAANATATGNRTDPRQWRRGLIISHTHIGDVLYRTCSLSVLREALPQCEWVYAASKDSAEALENNPALADILPVIDGENSWNLERGGFAALREFGFDAALCSNTLRHYPDLALATALRIPNRVGYTGKGFSGLINHPVAFDFPDSYASYFRTMVATVAKKAPTWPLRPRMYPSHRDKAQAASLWGRFGLGSRPVVACSLRTRQANGNWPEDVLLSVLKKAREQREFDVVLCGGPSDASAMRATAEGLPFSAHVLAGELGLLSFAAFLAGCNALLTLDSGPRHIGNAAGIPVLFARNLAHSRIEAGRYCETEIDLAPDVEYLSSAETEKLARRQSVTSMSEALLSCL